MRILLFFVGLVRCAGFGTWLSPAFCSQRFGPVCGRRGRWGKGSASPRPVPFSAPTVRMASIEGPRDYKHLKKEVARWEEGERIMSARTLIDATGMKRAAEAWKEFTPYYQAIFWMVRSLLPKYVRAQEAKKLDREKEKKEKIFEQDGSKGAREFFSRKAGRAVKGQGPLAEEEGTNEDRLLETRPLRSVVCVVIGGDRGSCGGLDKQVVDLLQKRAREFASSGVESLSVIVVGRRIAQLLERTSARTLIIQKHDAGKRPDEALASRMAAQLQGWFTEENPRIDAVEVISVGPGKSGKREARVTPLLPVCVPLFPQETVQLRQMDGAVRLRSVAIESKGPFDLDTIRWPYQSPETVFKTLVPAFISNQLFRTFLDSRSAEAAARYAISSEKKERVRRLLIKLRRETQKARQNYVTDDIRSSLSPFLAPPIEELHPRIPMNEFFQLLEEAKESRLRRRKMVDMEKLGEEAQTLIGEDGRIDVRGISAEGGERQALLQQLLSLSDPSSGLLGEASRQAAERGRGGGKEGKIRLASESLFPDLADSSEVPVVRQGSRAARDLERALSGEDEWDEMLTGSMEAEGREDMRVVDMSAPTNDELMNDRLLGTAQALNNPFRQAAGKGRKETEEASEEEWAALRAAAASRAEEDAKVRRVALQGLQEEGRGDEKESIVVQRTMSVLKNYLKEDLDANLREGVAVAEKALAFGSAAGVLNVTAADRKNLESDAWTQAVMKVKRNVRPPEDYRPVSMQEIESAEGEGETGKGVDEKRDGKFEIGVLPSDLSPDSWSASARNYWVACEGESSGEDEGLGLEFEENDEGVVSLSVSEEAKSSRPVDWAGLTMAAEEAEWERKKEAGEEFVSWASAPPTEEFELEHERLFGDPEERRNRRSESIEKARAGLLFAQEKDEEFQSLQEAEKAAEKQRQREAARRRIEEDEKSMLELQKMTEALQKSSEEKEQKERGGRRGRRGGRRRRDRDPPPPADSGHQHSTHTTDGLPPSQFQIQDTSAAVSLTDALHTNSETDGPLSPGSTALASSVRAHALGVHAQSPSPDSHSEAGEGQTGSAPEAGTGKKRPETSGAR